MFPIQGILRNSTRVATATVPVRNIVATPPRQHCSFAEKVVHGLAIASGVLFTPVWVIFHLDNYKHKS